MHFALIVLSVFVVIILAGIGFALLCGAME